MLRLKNINKVYKTNDYSVTALGEVSIDFRENEFVSILGPSGCGKTTLLNIIGGLDHYTHGDLIIKGKSTKNFKDRDWDTYRNHSVGFVFQSYNLIQHLSIEKNVELALTLSGISAKERKVRALEALERVGLKDQAGKRPNQLSGGQMQRVAIARAIVNNPEILLADEPTGALDTNTSVQIMDLIKEISKERLVIMVTHNAQLAEKYSTRIIRLLDGNIIDDSNPYTMEEPSLDTLDQLNADTQTQSDTDKENSVDKKSNDKKVKTSKKKNKTSMSFWTALSLSFKNLWSKKGRTILTSIAGSIGIIGIALVLSLSNGFNIYIEKMQADTLSSAPITISEEGVDIAGLISSIQSGEEYQSYPDAQKVFVDNMLQKLQQVSSKHSNITDEYVENVIKTIDPNDYYDILYSTGLNLSQYIYLKNGDTYTKLDNKIAESMPTVLGSSSAIQRLSNNEDFVRSQYDLIYGSYPSSINDAVLIVNKYNQISDITLNALGIKKLWDNVTEYDFADICSTQYVVTTNSTNFVYDDSLGCYRYVDTASESDIISQGITLNIVGILRPNEQTQSGLYSSGLAYTNDLYEYVLNHNSDPNSADYDIIRWMIDNPDKDPLTNQTYEIDDSSTTPTQEQIENSHKEDMRAFGGITTPNDIYIYAKDFDSKSNIKAHLDSYNNSVEDEDKVYYTDMMEMMTSILSTMVDSVSYVLIAFTAISLVVSSIMIGIITYVSVIERTKEIGILRSIGARKKDISRVFNAETFIIGLCAGLFGVIVAYILTIPINAIINMLVPGVGNLAILSISSALILVVISFVLTMISGLIPAKIASKKDPVEALRTE